MRVRVDSCLRIARQEIEPKLVEALRRELSFPNPAYLNRQRLGLAAWVEPEELVFLDEDDEEIRLPRGAIHRLRRVASTHGVAVACEDHRTLPAERLPELRCPPLPACGPARAMAS